jgi:hypothetical protein
MAKPSLTKLRAIKKEADAPGSELKRTTVLLPFSMIILLEEERLARKREGESVSTSALIRAAVTQMYGSKRNRGSR